MGQTEEAVGAESPERREVVAGGLEMTGHEDGQS